MLLVAPFSYFECVHLDGQKESLKVCDIFDEPPVKNKYLVQLLPWIPPKLHLSIMPFELEETLIQKVSQASWSHATFVKPN